MELLENGTHLVFQSVCSLSVHTSGSSCPGLSDNILSSACCRRTDTLNGSLACRSHRRDRNGYLVNLSKWRIFNYLIDHMKWGLSFNWTMLQKLCLSVWEAFIWNKILLRIRFKMWNPSFHFNNEKFISPFPLDLIFLLIDKGCHFFCNKNSTKLLWASFDFEVLFSTFRGVRSRECFEELGPGWVSRV